MKNLSASKELVRRLKIVSIMCFCFIVFLLGGIFYIGAKNEVTKLALINEHYAALSVSKLDTVLHDIRLALLDDEGVRVRLKDTLYYTDFVEAIYILDGNQTLIDSFKKNQKLSDDIQFYGFEATNRDVFTDKFVYNDLPDQTFILLAHKPEDIPDRVIVAMISVTKLANELFGKNNDKNYILDNEGFFYSPQLVEQRNIYDELNFEETGWQTSKSGFGEGLRDGIWRYYAISYVDGISLGFYSQAYFKDLVAQHGLLTGLAICIVVLLFAMLFDLVTFARKNFAEPLSALKLFFIGLSKDKFIKYDFGKVLEFHGIYKRAMNLYFDNKHLQNKINAYKEESQALFKHSNLIILYVEAKDGRIINASNKALEFYDYDEAEMLTKTIYDLEISNLYDHHLAKYGKIENGIPHTSTHVTRKGEKKLVSVSAEEINMDYNSFYIMTINDLTKILGYAENVRQIDSVMKYGKTMVLGVDYKLDIKQSSQNVQEITGYEKLIGANLGDFISESKANELKKQIAASMPYSDIISMKLADDKDCDFKLYLHQKTNGFIAAYIFLNDISEFTTQIKGQANTIKRYDEQLQGSSLITWEYDVQDKIYTFPSAFYSMIEQKDFTTSIGHMQLSKIIAPEYIALLENEMRRVTEDKKSSFEVDLQIITKQATDVWVRFKGHSVEFRTSAGLRQKIVGILENITEKIHTEARLSVLAQIFSKSKEAMFITAPNKEIIELNDSSVELSGYEKSELIGKPLSIIRGYNEDKKRVEQMWEQVSKTNYWRGEMLAVRKNQEQFPVNLTAIAIKDITGKITNFIAIFSDITELKDKEAQLERIAFYDGLTGLANKTKFLAELERCIEESITSSSKFAILYMDLDGFKAANDTYGHSCGDEVLIEVAKRLDEVLRQKGDMKNIISRFGGDEFVTILPDLPSQKHAQTMSNNVIARIGELFNIGDYNVKIGTTIGITYFDANNKANSHELLEQADWAMYQAKLAGKNRYYEFNETTSKIFNEYKDLLSRLESFNEDNFTLLYAPIYDLKHANVFAFEVQLKPKESSGALGAGDLEHILSQKYWFSDLNLWVISSALNNFEKLGLSGMTLFINTPSSQLNSNVFYKKFCDFAKGKDLSNIKILLSDIFTTRNPANQVEMLEQKYKEHGISFVIDGVDDRSQKFIESINTKNLRANKDYTASLLSDYRNIEKLEFLVSLCSSENKSLIAKDVNNAPSYKILANLGFVYLSGDFVYPACDESGIINVIEQINAKKTNLEFLSRPDNLNHTDTMNFFKFLIFQVSQLENVLRLIENNALSHFNFDEYNKDYETLLALQNESLSWVCEDSFNMIKNAVLSKNADNLIISNKIITEQLKLIKNITGE